MRTEEKLEGRKRKKKERKEGRKGHTEEKEGGREGESTGSRGKNEKEIIGTILCLDTQIYYYLFYHIMFAKLLLVYHL